MDVHSNLALSGDSEYPTGGTECLVGVLGNGRFGRGGAEDVVQDSLLPLVFEGDAVYRL